MNQKGVVIVVVIAGKFFVGEHLNDRFKITSLRSDDKRRICGRDGYSYMQQLYKHYEWNLRKSWNRMRYQRVSVDAR